MYLKKALILGIILTALATMLDLLQWGWIILRKKKAVHKTLNYWEMLVLYQPEVTTGYQQMGENDAMNDIALTRSCLFIVHFADSCSFFVVRTG